jgi:hypothetical protein
VGKSYAPYYGFPQTDIAAGIGGRSIIFIKNQKKKTEAMFDSCLL